MLPKIHTIPDLTYIFGGVGPQNKRLNSPSEVRKAIKNALSQNTIRPSLSYSQTHSHKNMLSVFEVHITMSQPLMTGPGSVLGVPHLMSVVCPHKVLTNTRFLIRIQSRRRPQRPINGSLSCQGRGAAKIHGCP